MSKENLEQFLIKVAESAELHQKLGEEIDGEALITLGAECGCEFTAEELQDFIVEYTTSEEWDFDYPGLSYLRRAPPFKKLHSRNRWSQSKVPFIYSGDKRVFNFLEIACRFRRRTKKATQTTRGEREKGEQTRRGPQ